MLRFNRRRVLVAAAISVVSLGAFWGWRENAERVRLEAVAKNSIRAQQLKEEIDRRLPIGTLETEVLDFLRQEHGGYLTIPFGTRNEYKVPVGNEPSDVWYCGSWTAGVRLDCRNGRLARTDVVRWSFDCL